MPWRSLASVIAVGGGGDRLPRTDFVSPCHRMSGLVECAGRRRVQGTRADAHKPLRPRNRRDVSDELGDNRGVHVRTFMDLG